ncbi:MarR family transcriptional regulator [Geoglobus acetivorans]|uniref:HTH marR-type domain-containing protein n=1 Tax=Geoglobus acetivorans TaxID=565033 RepID=A0A0A7GCY8_GEOAI|nr:hypothetical protein GACE_0892 [Geoglobus acetivorans]
MAEVIPMYRMVHPEFKLKSLSEIISSMLNREKEVVYLRTIPVGEAKKLVLDYIERHPGCWTEEIFMNLRLDPLLVSKVLRELEKEGLIEGRIE